MICNRCGIKHCRRDEPDTLLKCTNHVPIQKGWKLWEVAIGNSPQAVHDLMQQFNLKLKENNNG